MPVGEENVLGLDVAVHEARAVCVVEPSADFARDAHDVAHRQVLLFHQAIAQRSARNEGRDVIQQSFGVTGIDERNDVRMCKARGDTDLAKEPLRPHRCRKLGPKHFDRDLAAVLLLFGQVHRRHAAGAQLPLDGIPGSEGITRSRHRARGHRGNMWVAVSLVIRR